MSEQYAVILVHSTAHAMRAEHVLHQAGVATKLIPVPRHISSDCGVCVRVDRADVKRAQQVLAAARVEMIGVEEI